MFACMVLRFVTQLKPGGLPDKPHCMELTPCKVCVFPSLDPTS